MSKLIISALALTMGFSAPINHSYVQNVAIYSSSTETITDEDGEIFGVYAPDMPDNAVVWVTYDTMGTPTRLDDEVIHLEVIE